MAQRSKTAFVLAPFEDPFDGYYHEILRPCVADAGFRPLRADEIFGTRHIIADIWESIQTADVIVAEMTGRNANVLYEVGLSHAVGKPVVMITQSMDDIPFDLRAIRCLVYSTGKPKWDQALATQLAMTIKAVEDERDPQPVLPPHRASGSALLDQRILDELYGSTTFGSLMLVAALAEVGGGPYRLDDMLVQMSEGSIRSSSSHALREVVECRDKELLVAVDSRGRPVDAPRVGNDVRIVLTPRGTQFASLWKRPERRAAQKRRKKAAKKKAVKTATKARGKRGQGR